MSSKTGWRCSASSISASTPARPGLKALMIRVLTYGCWTRYRCTRVASASPSITAPPMPGSGNPNAAHTSPSRPRGSGSFDGAKSVQCGARLSMGVISRPLTDGPPGVGRTGGCPTGDELPKKRVARGDNVLRGSPSGGRDPPGTDLRPCDEPERPQGMRRGHERGLATTATVVDDRHGHCIQREHLARGRRAPPCPRGGRLPRPAEERAEQALVRVGVALRPRGEAPRRSPCVTSSEVPPRTASK